MRQLVRGGILIAVLMTASPAGADLAPATPAPPAVKRTCAAYEVVRHEGSPPTTRCTKYESTGPTSTRSGANPTSKKWLTPARFSGAANTHTAAHHMKRAAAKRHLRRGAVVDKGSLGANSGRTIPLATPANKLATTPKRSDGGSTVAVILTIIVALALAALALVTLARKRRTRWHLSRLRRSSS
jgi:hypothetical protein